MNNRPKMKKNITFKMWQTVFFGGIWQFIRNIFSWKNKTPFWRVVWATITICAVAFTAMLGYAFYDEFCRNKIKRNYYAELYDSNLSANYKFRNNGRDEGKSFIYDTKTLDKVLKGIDWIAVPEDGDSLIIVAKDGKRGFVNRFTAGIAIPFKYDAAWSFTDGVAAVCEGDSVYFIDHFGKPINNKKFARTRGYNNYVYHGNYAAIPENGKFGLIDRTGAWAVLPEYTDIHIGAKNLWYAVKNDRWGAIGENGQFVIPMEYEYVWIHDDNGITVAKAVDHSQSRYDNDGTLLDKFIFDEVYEMAYYINDFDDEGNQKKAVDNMLKYSANFYYGLMTRNGIPMTPPLYSDIECIAPGVYQCRIPGSTDCVMVNGKGEKIND